MRLTNKRIISLLLMMIAILTINFTFPQSAKAIIQQQQERPGQILYSSRHKLRDSQGNTWQVILFKRVEKNQDRETNLRLVSFPGQFKFIHPGNLSVAINGDIVFSARDLLAEESPSPNVGEFEVKEIISDLPLYEPVNLVLPSTAETPVEIMLPSAVILEWQELAKS